MATVKLDPALSGGGMLYDSGAHVMNSLVWIVESDVAEVHAYVDNLDTRVDINGTINVRFANGVIAAIAIPRISRGAKGADESALLGDLAATNDPYRCPHGRPIILRLSQEEMERRLGRR